MRRWFQRLGVPVLHLVVADASKDKPDGKAEPAKDAKQTKEAGPDSAAAKGYQTPRPEDVKETDERKAAALAAYYKAESLYMAASWRNWKSRCVR